MRPTVRDSFSRTSENSGQAPVELLPNSLTTPLVANVAQPRSRVAKPAAELVLSRGILGGLCQHKKAPDPGGAWGIGPGLYRVLHLGTSVNKGKEKGRSVHSGPS
jgi:hypothetical protein